MLLVLVFGSVFFIILTALTELVLSQNRAQDALMARADSFAIAEAGLHYATWYLAHNPDDLTLGSGVSEPYEHTYTDATTGTRGTYALSAIGLSACGAPQATEITSSGTSAHLLSRTTTIIGTYGSPSVGTYATIVNDGSNPDINFATLTPDFAALKATAQATGIYIAQHTGDPFNPLLGYHLIFNADGTVTINAVTGVTTLSTVRQAADPTKNKTDNSLIRTETLFQTLTIPTDCGLIFVEDNVWIEGVIPSKVTLVAANLTTRGNPADIFLTNNITYGDSSRIAGLTALAQRNVLIAPNSPTNLTLKGIFVAANGVFGRNGFGSSGSGCLLYEYKESLTISGTVVSKIALRTSWPEIACPNGSHAGYQTKTHSIDKKNGLLPPPFTPSLGSARTLLLWREL